MGSISEAELERQLKFQMEETIYEIMAWDEGYFRFEEHAEIAQHRLLARVRVESLLMEGARRIDEWTRLETRIPNAEAVPVLSPLKDGEASPIELRPDVPRFLFERQELRRRAGDDGGAFRDLSAACAMQHERSCRELEARGVRAP